jgi:Ca2+-binding RTX toxin-like protein
MVVKIGTFGNDLLIGSNAADSLQGSFGNDELRGLGGNDVLAGGGDHDTLNGGAGDDSLFGDGGNDTAIFATSSNVIVDLDTGDASSTGLGDDTLSDIENVTTGSGNDFIDGSSLANFIRAGGGADFILAFEGADTVYGDNGADFIGGGEGLDTLYGGAGADFLNGEEDRDIVDGGGGADEIFGGDGIDLLIGGGSGDKFVFSSGQSGVGTGNRDFIADFSKAQNDKIDLHFFDDLDFIGETGFSAPDQVRFFHGNGNTVIAVNTAGNSGAEMQIELDGIVNLSAADFIL